MSMTRISVESMNALQNITITSTVATGILCATDQLYQTKSKFHRKQQSYGPETNLLQGCPVTLNVATGLLQPKHLVMMIICTKQYSNPTTNNKVMAWKQMWDGRTDNAATIIFVGGIITPFKPDDLVKTEHYVWT